MKNLLFFLLFIFAGTQLTAQTFFRGTVIDEATKTPIANAKIGITMQGLGELSDAKGKFNYRKYDQVLNKDSKLVVTAPGYKPLTLDIEQIRAIYDQPVKLALSAGGTASKKKTEVVNVFWDVSEAMVGRDEQKELAYLENYLRQYEKVIVNLGVFSHKILFWIREDVVQGDISRFRESIKNIGYSGPADYSLIQIDGADEVLLFSNGNKALGHLDVNQDTPFTIATTVEKYRDEAYLQALARYTSGNYIALDRETLQFEKRAAVNEMVGGFIQSEGNYLEGAKILIKGTFNEFVSGVNGQFNVPAKDGDILVVSHLGMFTREVAVVKDETLLIDLIPKNNMLDEVIITAQKEKFVVNNKVVEGEKVTGAPGGITGRGYFYITSKDITPNGKNLLEVMREKFKGVWISTDTLGNTVFTINGDRYLFYLNGAPWQGGVPPIHIADSDISSIIVKDDPHELGIKYGILDPPGLWVIVTTKNDSDLQAKYRPSLLVKGNDYTEEVTTSNDVIVSKDKVKGTVASLNKPIQGASILKKGTFIERVSTADGSFTIDALPGDKLIVTYLGMFSKTVEVPETMEIDIDLIPQSDVLDEVVLTGYKEKITVSGRKIDGNTHPSIPGGYTALGDFYITSEDIIPNSRTIDEVIRQKFNGIVLTDTPRDGRILTIKGKTPKYVVDGFLIGPGEPLPFYIADNEIESIIVKESPNLTSRYSITPVDGLTVIITTNRATRANQKNGEDLLEKGNDYEEENKVASNAIISSKQNYISGIVSSLGSPLQGVIVTNKSSYNETVSDAQGNFKIKGKEGDLIFFSYLNMFPKVVKIEDPATALVVELLPKNDVLDEVVLTEQKKSQGTKGVGTPWALRNFELSSLNVKSVDGKEIESYPDVAAALNGKISNVKASWSPKVGLVIAGRDEPMPIVIDNQLFEPNQYKDVNPSIVHRVDIIKGVGVTTPFGTTGRNGMAIITTINHPDLIRARKVNNLLVKGNEYDETDISSIAQSRTESYASAPKNNLITGIVRAEGKPLQGVSVTIKGSFDEVYTNDKGVFEIDTPTGEVLVFNYLGTFPKEVLVEQRISNYTIDLIPSNSALDEIVVQGSRRVDNTIQTAFGEESKDKIGYAVAEIKKETFNTGATSLRDLITGRFSGVTVQYNAYEGTSYRMRGTGSINNDVPPIWVVNGTPYQDEPTFLDVQNIASISALKGLKAVNKYGTIARGGAFVITTQDFELSETGNPQPSSGLISGNNYQEDTTVQTAPVADPDYIIRLREISDPSEQFLAYQQMARTQELSLEFYSDVARFFQTTNLNNADLVRADLAYIARNNTKALRTLAYLYEEAKDYKNMLQTYERVVSIAPHEAQSYRDLANAYVINKKYNTALEMYRNMLGERIRGVKFTGIEPVLITELSRLVQLYKDKIEYNRLPNEWLRSDFKRDVRMVIEWSDRSVPFEFQFVNPEKKYFKWIHTLEENRERLQQEQSEGFQIEEFIIDDAPQGEWIINVQYFGDEGDFALPPFLKYTLYRNYGTPQETKQMRVVKLFKQTNKVTLGKIEI